MFTSLNYIKKYLLRQHSDESHQSKTKYPHASLYAAKMGDVLPLLGIILYGKHIQLYALWFNSYETMVIAAEPLIKAFDFSKIFNKKRFVYADQYELFNLFHAMQCSGSALIEHFDSLKQILPSRTSLYSDSFYNAFVANEHVLLKNYTSAVVASQTHWQNYAQYFTWNEYDQPSSTDQPIAAGMIVVEYQ